MLVLFTAPVCADIGNKTSSDATADKVGQVKKGDKSLPDSDKPKNGGKKDGSSAKKNAANSTILMRANIPPYMPAKSWASLYTWIYRKANKQERR